MCLFPEITGMKELRLRSQAVQLDLPRPSDVNNGILRVVGPGDPPLMELQKVELSWRSVVSLVY